jgi:hypothetical protein
VAPLPDVDALTKLIGVLLSGFGAVRFLEPLHKKRLAKATAEEAKILARAEVDVEKIRLEGKRELQELEAKLLPASPRAVIVEAELIHDSEETPLLLTRVRERTAYQEAKRQLNVEQVALEAANELRGQQASAEPVDEDWVARFFEGAKDVSSEEMQKLWAKILAGEVVRPGSFSLRCIEAVRNVSREEARLFESLSPYIIADRFFLYTLTPPHGGGRNVWLEPGLRLAEAGLLTVDAQIAFSPTFTPGVSTHFPMSDLVIIVTAETPQFFQIPAYVLTGVGVELIRLFRQPADRIYARSLVDLFRQMKYVVETTSVARAGQSFSIAASADLFPAEPRPPVTSESTELPRELSDK